MSRFSVFVEGSMVGTASSANEGLQLGRNQVANNSSLRRPGGATRIEVKDEIGRVMASGMV